MALALCLTLLPTAALADEPADSANGETKQEQENQQENQQETSAAKQEEQPTEEETSSPALLGTPAPTAAQAADTHTNHPICGMNCSHAGEKHTANAFDNATKLWMKGDGTLMKGEDETDVWTPTAYNSNSKYLPLEEGSYYLGSDLTLTDAFIGILGTNVTLCLNGKTIKTEGTSLDYAILVDWVRRNSTPGHLTLTDCSTDPNKPGTISGGKNEAVELQADSDLDMYGGTITGSRKGVDFSSGGTEFNMHDGVITGNSGYGVYMTAGTFNMSGGKITGNNVGVFVGSYSNFNVSGKVEITGNTANGKADNVHLSNRYQDKIFTVTSSNLQDGAKIGVTTEQIPSSESTVKIASAFRGDEKYIESDMDGYQVQYISDSNDSGVVLAVDPAAHAKTCKNHLNLNGGTDFIPWTDAEAKSQNSGKTASNSLPSKAGSYYLTGPVTLDAEWTPASGTTVLCLNGQTITGVDGQMTITVTSDRTFVLTDCQNEGKLVNRRAMTEDSRGVYVNGGSFTMYNGTVTGFADGVRVSSGATFAMYGGSVVNSRDFGVHNSGTFNMYGGSITGNGSGAGSSLTGCGVYDNGTMTVGGDAAITNNTNGSKGPCNVCLAKYDSNGKLVPITVNNDFTGSFGVTTSNPPYVNLPKQVTTGGGTIKTIISDNAEKYEIVSKEENLWLQVVKREPTAIAAPQAVSGLIYDGTPQIGVPAGEGYELTNNTATDAGSYTATATLKDGYAWSDGDTSNTKEISWSIAKKTPKISDFVMSKPTSLVYDGHEKPATVTLGGNLTGCDYVVEYYSDSHLQEEGDLPKNVGHYTFWVKVNESSKNFTASQSGISDTDWGFDILKADLTGITATGFNGGYDGNEHTITVTGAPEGTTIRYNSVDTPVIGYDNKYWGFSSLGYTNADNYTVYYRVYGDNYNTFGGSANINITKAVPEAPTGLRGTQGQTLSTVKLPEGWTWDAPNTMMDTRGEQIFKANYTDTTGNYENDSNVDVTVTVSNKTEAGVTIPAPAPKTYGDEEFTVTASVAAPGEHEKWINWRSSDPKVLEISNIDGGTVTVKVVGAGTAKLEVIYESDTTYGTAESNEITVGKATVTVTAKPQSSYVGGTAPDLSSPKAETHYTVTGLVGNDALVGTVTLKYQKDGAEVTPDTSKAGTYDIVISGVTEPAGGNYNAIVLKNGTLTISNRSTGGGGGGGSSSDRDSHDSNPVIKTETKNNTDGSTTKTETRRDGSVTQTTTGKDGSVSKTETRKDGSSVTENKAADGSTGTMKTDKHGQTEAKTALSNKAIEDAKKSGEPVKAPVEVEATRNSNTAPVVKVELPKGAGETKVEIPVSNANSGTVAVLVHPDGTEEILKDSVPTEDGIQLTVDGSATVKIVDNSKDFIDTRNHWAEDEIDFVSARELVNGISATRYAPDATATRAQLWTILARQNDTDLSGGANWYEKAQLWSKDKGISDGTNPNGTINRAQMVTMLWRTMGQPAAGGSASFADVPADSYYAQAVAWAIENGITAGVGGGRFDPNATCTRAQIATFLARSMK